MVAKNKKKRNKGYQNQVVSIASQLPKGCAAVVTVRHDDCCAIFTTGQCTCYPEIVIEPLISNPPENGNG